MSINRTAEYVVLWKSHKRAEWAAVGLDNQVAALRRQLARSEGQALRDRAPASDGAVATIAATVPAAGVVAEIAEELEFLERESRRSWQLHAEIGAELAQAEALLTVAQRQTAEKMLKQWEESGAGA